MAASRVALVSLVALCILIIEITGGVIDLNGTKAQMKQKASSLKCKLCWPPDNPCDGNNVTTIECESFEDRCMTVTAPVGDKVLVAKRCASSTLSCQEGDPDHPCARSTRMGIPCEFDIECCEGDMCNQASPGEVNTTAVDSSKPEVAAVGIKCPVCAILSPGAKECDEAEIVTCEPAGVMDRCISMDGVISASGVPTIPFQLKNCSSSFMCDPDNEYNMCNILNITGLFSSCSFTCTTPSSNAHAWNLGAFLGPRGLPNPNED